MSGEETKKMRAVATGVLRLGDLEMDCFVLEDETRVLSQRSVIRALVGQNGRGAGFGNLRRYLARGPATLAALSVEPAPFAPVHGGKDASGVTAEQFVAILKCYSEALVNGTLHPQQTNLGRQAYAVLVSLSGVGLTALIDEAAGYQTQRHSAALQRLFDRMLREQAAEWKIMWTPAIIGPICKAMRLTYDGRGCPPWFGETIAWIYDCILGAEVYGEMRKRNPRTLGVGSSKHHQYLSDPGRVVTQDDLENVARIAEQSAGRDDFKARVSRYYKGTPMQMWLQCA